MTGPRIQLVEDDAETRLLVAEDLARKGYSVHGVGSAAAATRRLAAAGADAVVLDLGLPDGNGLALCREWRLAGRTEPVLMLTASTDVASRVDGLDAGADDYLGKPFAFAELRARLKALLRRLSHPPESDVFSFGPFRVDFARQLALHGRREVPLTRRELEVLELLCRARGCVISREDLLDRFWGSTTPAGSASLDVIMGRLRRKLHGSGGPPLLRTLRGQGYAIAAAGWTFE